MSNDLKKSIMEDLKKTGFPLEVLITSELEKRGWIVYPSCLYKDSETSVSRELDIHAVKVDYRYAHRISVRPTGGNENKFISHLIIQCRKSIKPWVFFDNGQTRWPEIPSQNFKSRKKYFHELMLRDIDGGESLKSYGLKKHRYLSKCFHKSYHEAFSSPGAENKIYECFITVTKALDYFKDHYGTGTYVIHLFIPIIVFEGTLWSASIKNKKGQILHNNGLSLKPIDDLFVIFSRLTPMDKRKLFFEQEQIIEVVTRKAFLKKLDILERDSKELYKCWTNFISSQKR